MPVDAFDETFLVTDDLGFIDENVAGLVHEGTRFLSRLVAGGDVEELSCGHELVSAGLVTTIVCDEEQERLVVELDADYLDVFELRGVTRDRRGTAMPPATNGPTLVLGYEGLDARMRYTRADFSTPPTRWEGARAVFEGDDLDDIVTIFIQCSYDEPAAPADIGDAFHAARAERRARADAAASIDCGAPDLQRWLDASAADLAMLTARIEGELVPLAGIPWYATAFGRDSLITAFLAGWAYPDLGRGVARFLARFQADRDDPTRDAQPGKILHEFRRGEMAACDEIPYDRYYGSADATPLFVWWVCELEKLTGESVDDEVEAARERALEWMRRSGDEMGMIRYGGGAALVHQGWKDSGRPIYHADGSDVREPVAVCEIQGYAYAAWLASGHSDRARQLAQTFDSLFWAEENGCYCLAVDGEGRRSTLVASNAGHVLATGIGPTPGHNLASGRRMLAPDMFSGWGVRTLASSQPGYSPTSYHCGSVWPHDNAMIAWGLSRYGLTYELLELFEAQRAAARAQPRLPELFSGAAREEHSEAPDWIPVSCQPQAWAAASAFMFVRALLGLEIDGAASTVRLRAPQLPHDVGWMRIRNLTVGRYRTDLYVERISDRVQAEVTNPEVKLDHS